MNGLTTTIYRKSQELPEMEDSNFFHSRRLMEIVEKTPRQKPYMVVTTDESGRVVSHLLGVMRFRPMWLPPFLLVIVVYLVKGYILIANIRLTICWKRCSPISCMS